MERRVQVNSITNWTFLLRVMTAARRKLAATTSGFRLADDPAPVVARAVEPAERAGFDAQHIRAPEVQGVAI
jgi:hypothetical protein